VLGAHPAPAAMDDDVREFRRIQRIREQMRGERHRFDDR
jgi:hypothetical protein